jgi:hypothetical protein
MRIPKIVDVKNVRKMAVKEGYDPTRVLPPTQKGKKLSYLTPENKRVNFGSSEYESYDKHKDETRKANYLKRATSIKGDWKKDKYSANNLAINLLWSPKTKL